MANAVEEALARASHEQREKMLATIAEAQQKIDIINFSGDMSPDAKSTIETHEQIIDEARRNIPADTMPMQSVDTISPPMSTPSMDGTHNSTPIWVNSTVQNTIETIEQGSGNNYANDNYANDNAVDRALARQGQETPQPEPQQRGMGR